MLTENQLFANRYRLVKRLGQGAFSEVWKAEDTLVGNLTVALKVYAPDKGLDEDGAKVFGDEFAIVFNLHHQNLLTPSTFDKEKNSPYLVLPFCEQGSSLKLVGKMDERQAAKFLHDVSSALAYLHAKDIIHQDIKPDNVLIDGEDNYMVTDFGISTRIRSTLRRSVGDKKSAGTMAYMGPERFGRNPKPIKASDVWSLGATVYELMSGDVPFGDMGGGMQTAGAIVPELEGNYSAELKQLVEQCLAKDTWDRPTAAQLRDICDGYLRTGTWDLSSLHKGSMQEPKKSKVSAGRPTERKVRTVTPDDPVMNVQGEPAKVQRTKPKTNKKRWIILMSVILCISTIGITTTVIVKKARTKKELEKYKAETKALAQTYTINGVSFTMKYVEGGTFQMGATSEQGDDANYDEEPVHSVTVSDFCIGETEVTRSLWMAVMEKRPPDDPGHYWDKNSNHPANYVSWEDCQKFIQKLNYLTGKTFRLPTEAEWEYAARGGSKSKGYKYAGSNTIDDVNSGYDGWGFCIAKTGLPNELGLYDMSGNVSEWCQDWFDSYSESAQTDPSGPSSGNYRVRRGGNSNNRESTSTGCRVSNRAGSMPYDYHSTIGFRLVLVP